MAKIVIGFFMIFNIWYLNDNPLPQSQEEVFFYLDVDELPRFNKGNVFEYIYSNIEYPDQIDIQGKIIVSFIITKEGKVENVKLEKMLFPQCEEQIQKILYSMPSWIPGKKDGVKVNTLLLMPINFSIQ